jgi:hypothetical protein
MQRQVKFVNKKLTRMTVIGLALALFIESLEDSTALECFEKISIFLLVTLLLL